MTVENKLFMYRTNNFGTLLRDNEAGQTAIIDAHPRKLRSSQPSSRAI